MKRLLLIPLALGMAFGLAACNEYFYIPPNAIAMVLTPTGYDGKVLSPGQVNLGDLSASGEGNQLVLVERNGVQEKESFAGAAANEDKEDHRCLTSDGSPVTIDVRMLLALPDYSTPAGAKDLQRLLLLGRPTADKNQKRTMWITAASVYRDQAQQQARGKIRQVCASYVTFDSLNKAFASGALTTQVQTAVATALVDTGVPLRVIGATVSNLKPDPSVVEANAAKQAAAERIAAIKIVTDFLDADATGGRKEVYRLQVWQEIVSKGNANGHNTIFMTDVNNSRQVVPLPVK